MTVKEDRIEEALQRVNSEFEKALDGTIAADLTTNAQLVWRRAFGQTVEFGINRRGNNHFRKLDNKRYILRHARLIARIVRHLRFDANAAKVSEPMMKDAVDLVIQQARFGNCPEDDQSNVPGRNCEGYQGKDSLDV